ncbi:sensor histidine kinase [Methylobacterium platani]|uniref:histidine kinase n=2 Tax=Methylobacterium platani TaxID=427683 RepID=A0A179SFF7_9HYPH|nr:PAS domain S-box protein [Methylobacterium platani]KMO17670.1 histidine kinase [Methylobacterium platani JCM 14648]OAS25234.1 histidine kinase [Methylobacterium platani]
MAADTASPDGAEAAFRSFAEGAGLMIWRADRQARLIYVNPAWTEFRGRPAEQEIGHGWKDGLHPEDRADHEAALAAAYARRAPHSAEYRLRRRDGAFRWVHGHAYPLHRDGDFTGFAGSCFDITERKAAEEQAAKALAEQEALLAEIYHRVRNNLQVTVSLIGLFGRAAAPACRPAFDALGQRVRAIALVQQHLHEAPQIASVDLADYLTRLAEGLSQLRRAGRIAVTVEAGRTVLLEPRIVNALGMILAEIVAECLDGTGEGVSCVTRVEVPAGDPGEPVRVRIASSGVAGAPPPGVPRLGPRLIAAYAGQAEIAVSGAGTPEAPLDLTLPR